MKSYFVTLYGLKSIVEMLATCGIEQVDVSQRTTDSLCAPGIIFYSPLS